jgi:hypothetical protein
MRNKLYIGFKKNIELPKSKCLLIDDEVPTLPDKRRPLYFDLLKHSFNPLRRMDYRKACDFVDAIDAIFSRGESTLTKDTGLEFIADALVHPPASLAALIEPPDKRSSTGHIWAYGKIQRILRSPVLRRMLCEQTNFTFNRNSVILARVNRAELGEFDSLMVGLLLMAEFKGQLVVPDLGFYGRDTHTGLIREGRLIAGLNYLDELTPKLRRSVLSIQDRVAQGALYDDAETLALHSGLVRGTIAYGDYVSGAMA